MAGGRRVLLGRVLLASACLALASSARAGEIEVTKVRTGQKDYSTGYDEVFHGARWLKVTISVKNNFADPLWVDCNPAETGPTFRKDGQRLLADYDFVIDPGTGCPIKIRAGDTEQIVFWVDAPFADVNESCPPPFSPITVNGIVLARDASQNEYRDTDGTTDTDDWLIFEEDAGFETSTAAGNREMAIGGPGSQPAPALPRPAMVSGDQLVGVDKGHGQTNTDDRDPPCIREGNVIRGIRIS